MIKKALILIDASNLRYYQYEKHWWISWTKLYTHFQGQYNSAEIIYYEGIRSKATYLDRHPNAKLEEFIEARKKKLQFFKDLKTIGFRVVKKLVSRTYDHTEARIKHKCNFDVEITVDAIDLMDTYDECVLCSGDGDFVKLLKYLKGHKKRTLVVAPRDRLSGTLAKVANRIIFLEDIRTEIEEE